MPVPTLAATPLETLSMALLTQQLPSLPNFSGDQIDGDSESFSDWLERLELVAATCHWEELAKLVNIATRLRGSASRFYRSLTPQQRVSYSTLTAALRERFTPVKLQSVQSSKFQERKQLPHESVDNYAQDLRKLFYQAYSTAQDAGSGAEVMGRSVLAYQFVAGLTDTLKSKLVGHNGSFEELLCKARFEEARMREVTTGDKSGPRLSRTAPSNTPTTGGRNKDRSAMLKTDRACFSCGGTGHFARDCPFRGRGLPVESSAGGKERLPKRSHPDVRKNTGKVGMVRADKEPDPEQSTKLPTKSQDVVQEAVEQVMATMHGIETLPTHGIATLGPIPKCTVTLDSMPVEALIDTGSPISIVSLEFYMKAAAKSRLPHQSPADWGEAVRKKLQPTTVCLRSYGGDELDIVSQVKCQLSGKGHSIETVLQVQKGAPVDLLLGTDVLRQLGFALIQSPGDDGSTDLLKMAETLGDSPEVDTGRPEDPGAATSLAEAPTDNADSPNSTLHSDPTLTTVAIVKLIQAVRIPAQHSKLVRVTVDSPELEVATCLFEPDIQTLERQGLSLVDAVLEFSRERKEAAFQSGNGASAA